MWNASKYNVITNFQDKIVIHNLLTHRGIMIKKEDLAKAEKILEKPNEYSDLDSFKIFCDNGFVIPASKNEIEAVENYKNSLLEAKADLLSLTIIPTYQCNFKCIYCWENTKSVNNSMNEETQKKLLEFIQDKLKDSSALDLDWFGGEPLIAFDVMQNLLVHIDEMCKAYKKPYTCSLTTNGYGLTLDKFKFMLKYHTHFFQVTLDGTRELHNSNRPLKNGGETYDVIVKNLKEIRDNVREQYFRILIRLNVTEETCNCSKEYFEMIQKEFAKDKRFRVYIQAVEKHNEVRFDEMLDKYLKQHEVTEDFYDICIEKGIMTSPLKMLKPGDLMCKAMHDKSVFINSDGRIYKCDMDMQPNHVSYMGSLLNGGDKKLEGEKYDFWKTAMNKQEYCDECILLPLCCGLRCPYYNTLNPKDKCELYNNMPLVKNAIKSYAQENRYELISI